MRSRGRVALIGGAGVCVASWLLGSHALAAIGLGLLVAGAAAVTAVRVALNGVGVTLAAAQTRATEGDGAQFAFDVRGTQVPGVSRELKLSLGGDLTQTAPVSQGRARIELPNARRGSYTVDGVSVRVSDALGLEHGEATVATRVELLVRPRIPAIAAAFGDGGADRGSQRSRRRVGSGVEVASIREHHDGDALRSVHWPATARRARLMVREMEESENDDVRVVLDGVGGAEHPDAFDEAVRAVGAIVRAHAARGRRVMVDGVVPGKIHRVQSLGADWELFVDALAAAEPPPSRTVAGRRAAAISETTYTVTLDPASPWITAVSASRFGGVVLVDVASYAQAALRGPTVHRASLPASAAPAVVLQRGCDVAAVLAGRGTEVRRAAG